MLYIPNKEPMTFKYLSHCKRFANNYLAGLNQGYHTWYYDGYRWFANMGDSDYSMIIERI